MTMEAIKCIITGCFFPLNLLPTGSFFFFFLCMTDSVIVNGKNMFYKTYFPLRETESKDRYTI